jgi:hypothetical protein
MDGEALQDWAGWNSRTAGSLLVLPGTEVEVFDKSRRRCALCFWLSEDLAEKHEQVAHLDDDPSNYAESNLAFLCLNHHSQYNSKTSQHKNYTLDEVRSARSRLYEAIRGQEPTIAPAPRRELWQPQEKSITRP